MKTKILIGKAGLDGHDRGVMTVVSALKKAGFEVIYSGLYLNPEEFVNKAIDEDVKAIGMSIMTGAHKVIVPKVVELLNSKGYGHIPVFGGGIIPEEDIPGLKKAGMREVFLPGATLDNIVKFVKELVGVGD